MTAVLPAPWCTGSTCTIPLLRSTRWFQNLKWTHEGIIDRHHSPRVVKLSTVVGSRKDSNQFTTGEKFVTIFHDLVGSNHQIQIMSTKELTNNVTAKRKGNTTIIFTPALHTNNRKDFWELEIFVPRLPSTFQAGTKKTYRDTWVWVWPKDITEQPRIRNVARTREISNLLHLW